VATEAIEWMEIQAMARGIRPRDQRLVDDLFARRTARADRLTSALERMRELQSIANDFRGFENVSSSTQRAAALSQQPEVKAALEAERAEDEREDAITAEMSVLMEEVDIPSGLAKLKAHVSELLEQSRAAADSSARRIARRVLTNLRAAGAGTNAPELQTLLEQVPRTVR
jgi:uncharacterized protein YicC (UPF0701 family)